MTDTEKQELEYLREEVEQLKTEKNKLLDACQQFITRNMKLSEQIDVYYETRRRVEWLKEIVRKHRDMMAQADMRDDNELLALIEVRIEEDNIPLPPEFSIKDVAALVGTTQTRIAKLYKEKTIYHSVDQYLDFLRFTRALRLLQERPEYSIEAIAYEAGFNTVRTLNRRIQDVLGMTPRQFRDITHGEEE